MSHRILLIGGHGKVAQLLTPLLLQRSWSVTSMIRSQEQEPTILKLGENQPGKLDVLISSVEDVGSEADASAIIKKVNPDWIVWSAGAGGSGGPSRTHAIDNVAASAFSTAAAATPSVKKFLNISYIGSRRNRAPWWSDSEWAAAQAVNEGALKAYHIAKLAADEALIAARKTRGADFAGIGLRPGALTDGDATNGVSLGKIKARGGVSRQKVAEVVAEVLDSEYPGGWLDLLAGEDSVGDAVARCVREKVDCYEGEA
ncbi:NAD dependent epimerase/dehydratase [Eremomyces bilateralis CBS 781.70]|uniref:NAD dependent epimerase/dehydratase n=1 Tax=Eremomyces bilateralis CBS 781.70 TaxID=1392243 RepID=A0A6G1GGJ4_9PEZI|nr:NAD dependent epimerase/dehydratase [Eremomyces bilateralis CBS 781.70]KAF1817173.1 NAD dependent epimerase/dehydratase [Eremomyces bilateralis CBS 781.70]